MGDFRFGDSRATKISDSRGGCCGKPTGCNIKSDGCLHKVEKAQWQAEAEQELNDRERLTKESFCHACGRLLSKPPIRACVRPDWHTSEEGL